MPATETHRFFKGASFVYGTILFLIVFWAFFPAIHNGFTTYDDPEYITANPYVQSGLTLDGFEWAFRAHGANWHPLTWLSHIVDGQIFGLRPWGHHLGNVLLHAINALLVFWFLVKATGSLGRSFVVALLFGLHPLRVESVAWASERKDVLSGFFWLLTLLAYVEYARETKLTIPNRRKLFYGLALVLFALGLLSKSMVVTLPCVLLLLDFWPLQRWRTEKSTRLALEKVPFFLLTAAMSYIAYLAQYHGTALVSALPLKMRVANALVSYGRYLGKIFWPANLSPLYPYPPAWPWLVVGGAAALLVAITLLALWRFKQNPYLAMGWFWFLGTLVPVIGLVQVGDQSIADRYTYIPSLGILIALVWVVGEWTQSGREQVARVSLTVMTGVLALACVVLTREQIGFWRNTETMFARSVAVTQGNVLAEIGLGACLAERGKLDDAIRLYRQAIQVSPNYYEGHNNLGLALMGKGELDQALAEFQIAGKCRPGMAENNVNVGTVLAKQNDNAGAISQFEAALALDPNNELAHTDLGTILLQQTKFAEAAKEFKAAVSLRPLDPLLHYSYGTALRNLQRWDEAIAEFQTALKLAPVNAQIHNDLGTALGSKGDLDGAIGEFQAALKLNPQSADAERNLAVALKLKSKNATGISSPVAR